MSDASIAFTSTKMTRALKGAAKAGKIVTRAFVYSDNSIELEFADTRPRMTEDELLAGLEALAMVEEGARNGNSSSSL